MNSQTPTLGKRLRSLRLHNGWTLQQMSERSGIARSTLTKLEHDRATLTYDKLQTVSEKLGIPVAELFADPDASAEPAVTARRSIGRIDDALRVKTPNYDYFYMCPELRQKRMIPILVRVRAKSREEFGKLVRHPGEEYAHILEGRIVLHTEFYDPIMLEAGQSVYIDSNMGHAFTTGEGCDEAVMLSVCSSAQESLMESLLILHDDHGEASSSPAERVPVRS